MQPIPQTALVKGILNFIDNTDCRSVQAAKLHKFIRKASLQEREYVFKIIGEELYTKLCCIFNNVGLSCKGFEKDPAQLIKIFNKTLKQYKSSDLIDWFGEDLFIRYAIFKEIKIANKADNLPSLVSIVDRALSSGNERKDIELLLGREQWKKVQLLQLIKHSVDHKRLYHRLSKAEKKGISQSVLIHLVGIETFQKYTTKKSLQSSKNAKRGMEHIFSSLFDKMSLI